MSAIALLPSLVNARHIFLCLRVDVALCLTGRYIYIYIWGNCRGTGLDTANLRISSASPGVGDGCHCRKHSAKAALSRKALPGCLHSWSTCPRLARASRSSASQQLILENTSLERVMKALSEKYSNALTVPSEELVSIYSTSQLRSLHVVVGSHLCDQA